MSDEHPTWRWISPKEYFRRLWGWFKEGLATWIFLAVSAGFICGFLTILNTCHDSSEPVIRLSGMFLQLAGFVLAIVSLNSTLLHLGFSSLIRRFFSYLCRMPILPFDGVTSVTGTGRAISAAATVSGYGRSAGHSLEEKVQILEKQFDEMHREHEKTQLELHRLFEEGQTALEKQKQGNDRNIEALKSRFDRVFEGSANLEVVAFILFFVGVVLATASPEISALPIFDVCQQNVGKP